MTDEYEYEDESDVQPPSKFDILSRIEDLISGFLYYDRKEDEEVGLGVIEAMVQRGEITIDEMVGQFRQSLEKRIEESL